MEHAAMLVEWLRRNEPVWDARLRKVPLKAEPLGGDLTLCVGQDAAIGCAQYDGERVSLYPLESFTFLVSSPEVIVGLEGS